MTLPQINPLDRRLNVYSDTVADRQLQDRISAERYVDGVAVQVCVPVADLSPSSTSTSAIEAQLLLGQSAKRFDQKDGRSWIQADHNRYVGWVDDNCLSSKILLPTHRVVVPRTFIYPGPELKLRPDSQVSMGSLVTVTRTVKERGTNYAILENGQAMIQSHLQTVKEQSQDYVTVAESLLNTPYLWGGDSAFGLDCSGLVQLTMAMTGHSVLRDSDMQAATIGQPISPGPDFADLRRGDLIFWKGHVAIVQGNGDVIHANGHTMTVASEPLRAAIDRIAYLYDQPIGCRRP